MIRQPEREQLNRLTVKTLARVFIMRAKEGLGCSQFEAEALTNLVKEVCFPWLSQPEAIQAGQLAMTQAAHTLVTRYYTLEALASQPPVRGPVRKAKAGGCLDLPLYFWIPCAGRHTTEMMALVSKTNRGLAGTEHALKFLSRQSTRFGFITQIVHESRERS